VRIKGIDPPVDVVAEVIGLPKSPIIAFTPGARFELAFAKYAVAVCPLRLAVMARRCAESKADPTVNVNDCWVWPWLNVRDPGRDTAESLLLNSTVCVEDAGNASDTVAEPWTPVSGEDPGVISSEGAGAAETVLIEDVAPTRSSRSVTPIPR
jgi:hypothetical protein